MKVVVFLCAVLCSVGFVRSTQVEPARTAASTVLSNESSPGTPLRSKAPVPALAHPLKWDATTKDYEAKPGETRARLLFAVTNVSDADVVVTEVLPSCGCTSVSVPGRPWRLAPGAGGEIQLDVDLTGKSGQLNKTVQVETSHGSVELRFCVRLPDEDAMRRARNQQFAATDRQLVFKGDCAKCHAEPLREKTGRELFVVACAICHAAAERASMVPDLRLTEQSRSAEDWEKWISHGREGSLMPAFSHKEGGPLTDEQIASLVKFLVGQSSRPSSGGAK
jgi:cytochrome c5